MTSVLCCLAKVVGSLRVRFVIVPALLHLWLLPAQLHSIILSDHVGLFQWFFSIFIHYFQTF